MNLDNTNNYIQTLLTAGDDAHSNLYWAKFSSINGPLKKDSAADSLSLRCDGFTPPPTDQAAYSVSFMNQTIERPVAKVNVTRNFSLTFRVDANYLTFKTLLDQQGILFNPAKGFTATSINKFFKSDYLFNTELFVAGSMVDTNPTFSQLFAFRGCWISKITPISYTSASSDAAKVTLTINFLTLEDLHSGFGTPNEG